MRHLMVCLLYTSSYNNEDKQLILNNRKQLAKLLKTDLEHMVAPHQTHSANFKEVSLKDGGRGMYCQDDAFNLSLIHI